MSAKQKRKEWVKNQQHKEELSKKREEAAKESGETGAPIPLSFVIRRGLVGKTVKSLVDDLRKVMEPHTVSDIKMSSHNKLSNFREAAMSVNATHLVALSTANDTGNTFLRIGRLPKGPTVGFRVKEFVLASDIARMNTAAGKSHASGKEFNFAPLVVLSQFSSGGRELILAGTTLQNMFAPINVEMTKVQLLDTENLKTMFSESRAKGNEMAIDACLSCWSSCKRIVLFQHDPASGIIHFRHYMVMTSPSGMNRNVKRVLQSTKAANLDLSKQQDIADFVLGPAAVSESEASDMEDCKVELPETGKQSANANASSGQTVRSTVRLIELGPRMELQLFRVQDGLFEGKALFGAQTQKPNPSSSTGKKSKGDDMEASDDENEEKAENDEGVEDDDTEWFRREVGEEPDDAPSTTTPPTPSEKKQKRKDDKKSKEAPAVKKQKQN